MKKRDVGLIQEIRDFIHGHLSVFITVDDLCKMFHINRTKLQSNFNILYGSSIRAYIIRKKMQAAADRLQESDDSIKEIAIDLGYSSSSNFAKTFKQVHNMSPDQFRKNSSLISSYKGMVLSFTLAVVLILRVGMLLNLENAPFYP